jgi:hypothetical protein
MAIPKIIHYCWLSNDPVPEDYKKCIASWLIKLSAYQFVLWDAARFDVNKTTWTRQAFEVGMYACAADYIRLYAVYHHGGIYLDMDMEIIKPFDDLLESPLLLGYENHISENIEAGCFGAEAGHPYLKKCMEYFETRDFFPEDQREAVMRLPRGERHDFINPAILPAIMKNTLQMDFQGRNFEIRDRHCFTAKNVMTGEIETTEETRTIHHFATAYHTEEWRKDREGDQSAYTFWGQGAAGKIGVLLRHIANRVKRHGLLSAAKYYRRKMFSKDPAAVD